MSNFDVYECAVLSLCVRADYAAQVFSEIKPGDFSADLREYAQAAFDLLQENRAVDVVTVAERMEANGAHNAMEFVSGVVEQSGRPVIDNLNDYCAILGNRGLRRNLYTAAFSAKSIIEEERDATTAQQKILAEFEAIKGQQQDESLWDMSRASREFLNEMQRRNDAGGELIGLSTGWKHMDNRINGMRGGDLIVVAGRPSMGKSTFALNMVEHNAAREKVPSLIFSMEMSSPQLIEKMTASLGQIDLTALRKGQLTEAEWAKFTAASKVIQSANLFIDDRGGLSVSQMRARAHEIRRRCGSLGLIMVDYLQLMTAKAENRTNEITKITGGLKSMAKEFKCPVIALSQLNRAVEQRSDKRPMMSDLRESGSIEQDADIIIFPFREGYYDNPDDPDPTTEIIFGKIRMGERGTEGLEFQGKYSRFKSLDSRIDFAAMRSAREEAEMMAQKDRFKKKSGGGMTL